MQAELLELFADAVRQSTTIMKVCVPSNDFYARGNDWYEDEISFVDPRKLLDALEELVKERGE